MLGVNIQRWLRSTGRNSIGFLFLAITLLALAGCVTLGKPESESIKRDISLIEEGPSVARLADGREGFMIKETPHLEMESVRHFERAVAMMENQEYQKAAELLEKLIEQSPGVTAPYINLAIACRHLDRLEEAEKHLKTALGLVPGHPVASNEYGLLLRKSGRFAEAMVVYEKALSTFPDYQPLHRNLGILCDLYLNDTACALDHYEIYSQTRPEDRQVKSWIADLRIRLGKN